ncbi:Phosphopentomutase [Agrobacterium sp. DSM 25558]|uniref:phosphopentomutase n=1 Tax=Agrobacterium sp. DSM 25558 TaxID=1907665 RepID=UPI0009725922|nr:phosphopentomutase [Agrobacterium sp. DSM 25558]SCX30132.1 Phosphopentomutase [Agrobacterium sp. DSM 25558]
MTRAIVIVLDSVGIGGARDAHKYGDTGANTVGHILEACNEGRADRAGLRQGPLEIPNLAKMGLLHTLSLANPGVFSTPEFEPEAIWGAGHEISGGKDTPSGHWELCGVPVTEPWTHFPATQPSFPPDLVSRIIDVCGLPGILGDKHASGMDVILDFGIEHMRSGKPICYTSADSVFQIAAHEQSFGLARLYDLCAKVFEITAPMRVGRVIARPFLGGSPATFWRTANRKDFTVEPPDATIFDLALAAGRSTSSVGKIGDIFSYRGVARSAKAADNMAMFDVMLKAIRELPEGGYLMANFVDFDSEFGHRRDVAGYAHALEAFDRRLPELSSAIADDDLVIITADHGNDPTFSGSDHTRECVPILIRLSDRKGTIGARQMADVGASVCDYLDIPSPAYGSSFL